MERREIIRWLREEREEELAQLWEEADRLRRDRVGDEVHLRGLIEISNVCRRQCHYCGLRAGNRALGRYRMSADEILACAGQAAAYGYGTVVMQSGEDEGITGEWMAGIIARIRRETPLAVTLSLGERSETDLVAWREAGADRYLLRFETSNRGLYDRIHPSRAGLRSDRLALLIRLRELGYEIGSGVMVGIPGQTHADLAEDLTLFRELDLDMIGIGPFIAHPATPLGRAVAEGRPLPPDQVPATEGMTCKAIALARLLCPEAHIPSTTALATINRRRGRELGLTRGANVVMPNLTPSPYRAAYEIYPDKTAVDATAEETHAAVVERLRAIGRIPGRGKGGRRRRDQAVGAAIPPVDGGEGETAVPA